MALRKGYRGLDKGSSLPRLLAERRGLALHRPARPLTLERILEWADCYHAREGKWPTRESGPIPEAPGGQVTRRTRRASPPPQAIGLLPDGCFRLTVCQGCSDRHGRMGEWESGCAGPEYTPTRPDGAS